MASLYRYLPAEQAESLIHKGEVWLSALTYFQRLENDDGVRSDPAEGRLPFRPENGLEARDVKTGKLIAVPPIFEPRANSNDIFVYCLSTELSADLAVLFNRDTCVEITNPAEFFRLIERELKRHAKHEKYELVHDAVSYRNIDELPGVNWALPEKITLSKLKQFAWQREYRIAYGIRKAFNFENVSISLHQDDVLFVDNGTPTPPHRTHYLGDISHLCKVHVFPKSR